MFSIFTGVEDTAELDLAGGARRESRPYTVTDSVHPCRVLRVDVDPRDHTGGEDDPVSGENGVKPGNLGGYLVRTERQQLGSVVTGFVAGDDATESCLRY